MFTINSSKNYSGTGYLGWGDDCLVIDPKPAAGREHIIRENV
jgi:hypothetical protein